MLKVNIDASWSTAEQEGKMVLIVRDSLGECIYACGQGLGPVASAHLAELLSLRLACEICSWEGWSDVHMEVDAKEVAKKELAVPRVIDRDFYRARAKGGTRIPLALHEWIS